MAANGTLRVRIIGDSGPFEKTIGGLGKKLGAFGVAAGAAVAGFAAFSVKKFADFDGAMQKSVAIMGDVSDAMRKDMSDAAREVAKTTTFSAEEAAESYFFLASAGLDAAESIEALPKVAAFAQAGAFDMAQATDLLTDAQSALGLTSDDTAESLDNMAKVGDVLVKANTLANASVEQFATALTSKAGNALQSVGKDVEEGVAALSVFADQGIKGERAGTLLANTLQGLSDGARNNADAFDRLGVSVFDSDGNMNNLADIAGDLEGAFEGMSVEQQQAELAALGFNKQAREGILALMGNSEALEEYEESLRDAGGTADEVAGKQLETFHAQLGLLKDQFFDVALSIGETLMPHIMAFVEALQEHMPAIQAFIENALTVMATVITDYVVPAFQALAAWWAVHGPAIIAAAQALWEGIKAAFDLIVGAIQTVIGWFQTNRDQVTKAQTGLLHDIMPIWEQVKGVFDSALEFIRALVDRVLKIVKGIWDRWGADILKFAMTLWQSIRKVVGGALDIIQGIFEVFAGLFSGDWSRMWEGVKQVVSGIWNVIVGLWDTAIGAIVLAGQVFRDTISELWGKLWDKVKEVASNAWDALKTAVSDGIDDILGFFRKLPGRLVSALGNLGNMLKGAGRAIMDGLLAGLKQKWEDTKDFLSGLGSQIKNLKGPLSYDKVMLKPEGQAIIGGLAESMEDEWARVEKLLGTKTAELPNMVGAGKVAVGSGGAQMPRREPVRHDTGPTRLHRDDLDYLIRGVSRAVLTESRAS